MTELRAVIPRPPDRPTARPFARPTVRPPDRLTARLYFPRTHSRPEIRLPDVPYRVDKPWGYELVWARTDRYAGKILHVKAGHVLSLQYHHRKDETMHVLAGELILRTREGEDLVARRFRAGESVHIPPTLVHQIEAVVDSDVLEASTAELDDLVRLQDRYGRG